jgi:multidrug efflux pump subunit AcrB
VLKISLGRPIVTSVLVLLSVLILLSFLRQVPTEMYPASSRPEVLVYVDLPAGYNIFETERVVAILDEWLLDEEKNPGVQRVSSYIGTGGPRISLAIVPPNPASHRAFMIVTAKDNTEAKSLLRSIRKFSAAKVSQAAVRTELLSRGIVPPGVVELRFSGPDANQLYTIARNAEQALAELPDTLHVRNDWENRTTRYKVMIDQARTYRAGVSYEQIATSLNASFSGNQISELRRGDTLIPILTRSPQQRGGVEAGSQLGSIKVPVGDGSSAEYVTLDQLASFEEVVQFGNILRRDMEKTITVSGKHLRWDSAKLQQEWNLAIADITENLPRGYRVEVGGELEILSQSTGPMLLVVPLFLGLVLCVLMAQFNSVRRTVIVVLAIPMAMSGGVIGLYVTGAKLDFIGMLGFLSLAGIVINHAIVLIDKADQLVEQGESYRLASEKAARHRLRPVLVTSITTILGLVPLVLMEEALFHSMAIVIMSGLAVGTFFTLIAVPALYCLLGSKSFAQIPAPWSSA